MLPPPHREPVCVDAALLGVKEGLQGFLLILKARQTVFILLNVGGAPNMNIPIKHDRGSNTAVGFEQSDN